MLRAVLYYDVFRHPLAVEELAWMADGDPAPAVAALGGRLERRGRWVFRAGRGDHVEGRLARARAAERLWPAARRAGRTLAAFPWVRGVLVTGGLSKGSVGDDADVDFLLVVEPGRVWTAKSALQAFRRVLPERLRECFCTNYLVAADRLEIEEQDVYTAMELATAVPLHGADVCARLLDANTWARRFVPGLAFARARAERAPTHPRSGLARVVEPMLGGAAEAWSARTWDRYWNRKYDFLDEATRAQRFKRGEHVATNHLHDFREWVIGEFTRRCAEEGVTPWE
ncbi:MAG: hypothetical protein ACOZNI_18980 [Myxococcota bacterium]